MYSESKVYVIGDDQQTQPNLYFFIITDNLTFVC
jgi:hypothetical protein